MKLKISKIAKWAIGITLALALVYLILFFILRKPADTSIKDVQAQIKDVQQSVQSVDTKADSALQLLQSSQLNYKTMIEAIERSEKAANNLKQSETAASQRTAKRLEEMKAIVEAERQRREALKQESLKYKPLTRQK